MRSPRVALPLAAALLLGACSPRELEPTWSSPPPNVLLLSVDTLRADHLGCYGYGRDTSPAIDRLAATGILFENAQAASSWTLPGLASVITSQHTSTTSCWSFSSRLDPSFTTLAEYLRDDGYDTASVYSHQFLSPSYGLQQGIIQCEDQLPPAELGSTRSISSPALSDAGIRFLRAKAKAPDGVPWFLWVHYFDPHDAYLPHPGITERFEDPADSDPSRALYDGEIRFTDDHLGRVLEALEEAHFPNGTIVVLLSDHGEEFGEHGGRYHGHTLFDELTRVPFVLRAPGLAPRRVPGLVRMVDVLPTILDLVSHPVPADLAGESLLPRLRGENSVPPPPALSEVRLRPDATLESIQDPRWKLVRSLHDESTLLFDLLRDPGQLHDVAAENPDVVRDLSRALRGAVQRAEEAGLRFETSPELDLTPTQLEDLRRLGYVGNER